MDAERFDHVVLGAGLRGLHAALHARRTQPAASLLLVDAAPRAGGRTAADAGAALGSSRRDAATLLVARP